MKSRWQQRIERAQELMTQQRFAAEILEFYIHVAEFQEALHRRLAGTLRQSDYDSPPVTLRDDEISKLAMRFSSFLSMVEQHGPAALAALSRDLASRRQPYWTELLREAWSSAAPSAAPMILAQAFLQPCAELLRSEAAKQQGAPFKLSLSGSFATCPFCTRKPTLGVLRPLGDGGARSLVCSFCMAEWDFRRLVCPGCGEENDKKLAVYTADDFEYIRVECCETCKTYIKTIDLTKNGRAEPLVDELASAPLDLWAREHGYAKLHANILGM